MHMHIHIRVHRGGWSAEAQWFVGRSWAQPALAQFPEETHQDPRASGADVFFASLMGVKGRRPVGAFHSLHGELTFPASISNLLLAFGLLLTWSRNRSWGCTWPVPQKRQPGNAVLSGVGDDLRSFYKWFVRLILKRKNGKKVKVIQPCVRMERTCISTPWSDFFEFLQIKWWLTYD